MFKDIRVKYVLRLKLKMWGNAFTQRFQLMMFMKVVQSINLPVQAINQYIGENERQLFVRIKEHVTPTNTVVFNCAHCKTIVTITTVLNY